MTRIELIDLHKSITRKIMKLKLVSLDVKTTISSKDGTIEILVFNSNCNNRSFYIYNFNDFNITYKNVRKIIKTIKTDHFAKIKILSEEIL